MFGSEMLDVALGLVLVFLLVSLVLTAVQEAIESWLRSRAGDLNRAIFELLQRDDQLVGDFYNHPLIFALHRAGLGDDLTHAVHKAVTGRNPFGRAWREVRAARAKLPSYIPREAFSAALLDLLASGKAKGRIVETYDALDRLCGGNPKRLRAEIEGWYDGAMDRASGWYKRRTQIILFWLGLVSAILLNLNAVTIGNYLATNKQAREYATQYAGKLAGGSKASQGQGTGGPVGAPGYRGNRQSLFGAPGHGGPADRLVCRHRREDLQRLSPVTGRPAALHRRKAGFRSDRHGADGGLDADGGLPHHRFCGDAGGALLVRRVEPHHGDPLHRETHGKEPGRALAGRRQEALPVRWRRRIEPA